MARTIDEIQNEIITEKAKHSELDGLNSKSSVSVWRLFTYIVSYSIFTLEKLFDNHKSEVSSMIAELKPHSLKWYRNKALAFQYGFKLQPDSDKYNNSNYTDREIEDSKIVKYAAVSESTDKSRLIIKIAGETKEGELEPITDEQKESFIHYLAEIRDAGVNITVTNNQSDLLWLTIKIIIDPLVLDKNGYAIAPVNNNILPVEKAIKDFLRRLPFNGELVLSSLTDTLQMIDGVKDIKIVEAKSASVDSEYNGITAIDMSRIPESGYFKTKQDGKSLIKITYDVV